MGPWGEGAPLAKGTLDQPRKVQSATFGRKSTPLGGPTGIQKGRGASEGPALRGRAFGEDRIQAKLGKPAPPSRNNMGFIS